MATLWHQYLTASIEELDESSPFVETGSCSQPTQEILAVKESRKRSD